MRKTTILETLILFRIILYNTKSLDEAKGGIKTFKYFGQCKLVSKLIIIDLKDD
jgi:hypothetical protein